MNFVSGLPRTQREHDAIWIIVNRLTKSTHFLPISMKYFLEKLAKLYLDEIIRLHGIPVSIVSDRDPRFVSRFWQKMQESLGTKLYHLPPADRCTIGKDNPNFRGYVEVVYGEFWRKLESVPYVGGICL